MKNTSSLLLLRGTKWVAVLGYPRYVERNPVRAGLCRRAADYRWSSAAAHAGGRDDELVQPEPLLRLVPNWGAILDRDDADEDARTLRRHEANGRPLGSDAFMTRIEALLQRVLRPQRPGRRCHIPLK